MAERPAAVLFDLGGTLAHLDGDWLMSLATRLGASTDAAQLARAEAAVRRAGWSEPVQPAWSPGERAFHASFGAIGQRLGLDAGASERFAACAYAEHRRRPLGLWLVPDADARPLLVALRGAGIQTGVVSNNDGRAQAEVTALGLADLFDVVVDSQLAGARKPDPAIFLPALARLSVRPEATLYVGDAYAQDVVGARAAGITPVLYDPLDLRPEADVARVRRLAEVAALAGLPEPSPAPPNLAATIAKEDDALEIRFADIAAAHRRIEGRVRRTPLVLEPRLSERRGSPVHLKLECWQTTGSFKYRGALHRVLMCTPEERARGLLAVSAGNHALGVATAAAALGMDLLVVMPRHAPQVKVDGVRRLGARVELAGDDYDEAEAAARQRLAETGRTPIHPFEDPVVIAGQGTVGLEIGLDGPPPDVVLVPAGGGGLVVGVAVALKTLYPATRVIGVQSEASAPFVAAFRAGRHVPVAFAPSIADGLHGDTTPAMVDLALRHVDAFVSVSEDAIRRAMRHLFASLRLVVEGSAAVGVAALLEGLVDGGSVATVLTGSNIDPAPFLAIATAQD